MSSIPIRNETVNINSQLARVSEAARACYRAPNKNIETEMLQVIEDALPEAYVVYTTPQGIIVERLVDEVKPPRIHLHVKQKAKGRDCPRCKVNLLLEKNGEIVDTVLIGSKTAKLTVACRHCGQFWVVGK